MVNKQSFNPAHNNTGKHLRSGVLNTGVIQVIKVLCSFASVIVLSRLLPPSDFGVVAMVGPVVAFIGLFQDLGLSQATVQKQTIGHDEVNAFFWINVALGLVLALTVAAISPLVGWYYHDERVVALTIAMGGLIFLGSCGGQHGALLSRRMEFTKKAVIDGVSTVGALAVAIACALTLKNYWALYWATLAGTVISLAGAWIASGWRPSWPRKVSGLKGMLKFGAGMTITNFMNFIGGNIDNVLIGRVWGNQELGLYDRAYKLLLFPLDRIIWPIRTVMIPILSRLMQEPEEYRKTYIKVVSQLRLFVWPGIIWAGLYADELIPLVLGEQWKPIVPVFRAMAFVSWLRTFTGGNGWLLVSQGRARDSVKLSIMSALQCLVAVCVGLPYGIFGVAVSCAVFSYIFTPITWWIITRHGPIRMTDIMHGAVSEILSCCVSIAALVILRDRCVGFDPYICLAVALVVAYSGMFLPLLCCASGRETLRTGYGFLLGFLRRR